MQCQQTLAGHSRGVTSIAYCPITEYLFTGSHDTTIKVFIKSCNEIGVGSDKTFDRRVKYNSQ